MIIARPCPTQPTPPNRHTPFEKGDLIPRKGSSTNRNPTYMSLLLCTSWSLTPCPTHFSSALQKLGIPNHVVFASNSGCIKPRVLIPTLRQLYAPTTWPHSTNQLQFHSTRGHHDTLYSSNIPPLNSQVLTTFPPSAITPATH